MHVNPVSQKIFTNVRPKEIYCNLAWPVVLVTCCARAVVTCALGMKVWPVMVVYTGAGATGVMTVLGAPYVTGFTAGAPMVTDLTGALAGAVMYTGGAL